MPQQKRLYLSDDKSPIMQWNGNIKRPWLDPIPYSRCLNERMERWLCLSNGPRHHSINQMNYHSL